MKILGLLLIILQENLAIFIPLSEGNTYYLGGIIILEYVKKNRTYYLLIFLIMFKQQTIYESINYNNLIDASSSIGNQILKISLNAANKCISSYFSCNSKQNILFFILETFMKKIILS